jgi:hypothetical protein
MRTVKWRIWRWPTRRPSRSPTHVCARQRVGVPTDAADLKKKKHHGKNERQPHRQALYLSERGEASTTTAPHTPTRAPPHATAQQGRRRCVLLSSSPRAALCASHRPGHESSARAHTQRETEGKGTRTGRQRLAALPLGKLGGDRPLAAERGGLELLLEHATQRLGCDQRVLQVAARAGRHTDRDGGAERIGAGTGTGRSAKRKGTVAAQRPDSLEAGRTPRRHLCQIGKVFCRSYPTLCVDRLGDRRRKNVRC